MPEANPHHFTFDLDRAILSQVVEALETSQQLTLAKGIGPQWIELVDSTNSFR